jgi:outer membrane biosynthesis protein TonB
MAERPLYRHCVVRLLGVMALTWGLGACSVENRAAGPAKFDAAKATTPNGRYVSQVMGEVSKKWDLRMSRLSLTHLGYGSVQVAFYVNKMGKVEDLRILNRKNANLFFTGLTLQAVHEAKFPPMSAAVLASLPKKDQGRLPVIYNAVRLPPKGTAIPKVRSVATKNSLKDRYTRQVLNAVEKKWVVYRKKGLKDMAYGSVGVEFYVTKQGKVEDLRALNGKNFSPKLTGPMLQAICDAEIPPMPADLIPLLPPNSHERLKITYDALIY